MVKLGFTRAYGTSLQQLIAKNTKNRFQAFLAGIGATTILQSSTATTLICVSFASKQAISTTAAIAVVIGADVGTTLVAQILVLDLSWLTPVLLVTGVALHSRYEHGGRKRHIARAMIGLGLILISLSIVKESAAPLAASENLPLILKSLENDPLLAILIAALITWILHSSLATVLIIASFANSGLISLELGLLLVLGANLGGAIVPYVIAYKMGTQAKRITTASVLMRFTSIILVLPFLSLFSDLIATYGNSIERDIINFHMLFNLVLAVMFLPLIRTLTLLCTKLVPKKSDTTEKKNKPAYLDNSSLETPTIALASAARETLRVAKIVQDMFEDSMIALKDEDPQIIERIRIADDRIDDLHTEIKLYLTRLNEESLDPKEADRFVQILSFSTNLEHIGDIIDTSLREIIKTKISSKKRFSKEGFQEIREFHQTILTNMKISQTIFMSEDPALARQLVEAKANVRKAAQESTQRHFERLRAGLAETKNTSSLHTDIIRDYKRINSYITSVAFNILENTERYKEQRKEKTPPTEPA